MPVLSDNPVDLGAYKDFHGDIVSWYTRGKIQLSKIREGLAAGGFDGNEMPDLPLANAFTRSLRIMRAENIVEKVDDSGDVWKFQVTKSFVDSSVREGVDKERKHTYHCQISVNTKTGTVECEDEVIRKKVLDAILVNLLTRTSSDISRMVQRLFKENADIYPINPQKGVAYFVPIAHKDVCDKIDLALTTMGGVLTRYPIPAGTPTGDRSVKVAVKEGMEEAVDELRKCVEGWDGHTRKGTMARAIVRWNKAKHKAESWAAYFDDAQSTVLGELETVRKDLVGRIKELTEKEVEDKPAS